MHPGIRMENKHQTTKHKNMNYFVGIVGAMSVAALMSCTASTPKEQTIEYSKAEPLNPPHYVCYKLSSPINIDGKLSAGEWDSIPWTSDFVDIEGDKQPKPYFQTRAKMAYDDDGMYFAALMEEPHVWATLLQHDTVIFYDNDFEIFIDPTNDTHNYLEYEVNAFGTDWDLFLTKPYRDGPKVLNNWEFAGMKDAVFVEGTVNNPGDTDKSWSFEAFIPWSAINQAGRNSGMPQVGDQMRVNFSRVQWTTEVQNGKYVKVPIKGEDKIREHNWVWAPTGVINIHLPEYWGYVQFSDKTVGDGISEFQAKPEETTKWVLRQLYYRQKAYAEKGGEYAKNIATLKPSELVSAQEASQITLATTPSMFEITMPDSAGTIWHIRQDGLVWK